MDWRDLVTIALAGVVGMVGGVFGPVGIIGGVVLGAAVGARWGVRADRVTSVERGHAELESAPDDGSVNGRAPPADSRPSLYLSARERAYMGLLGTITDTLKASSSSTNRGDGASESKGAYWCHDCSERILDIDVEGDDAPTCPSCGEAMEFERSPGSTGCAC